jgi:Ser/Thr protein kinase RdoA (MazF antagonist)
LNTKGHINEMIDSFCENFHLHKDEFIVLEGGLQNILFAHKKENYVIRMSPTNKRTVEQIQEELEWIHSLISNQIKTPLPLIFNKKHIFIG